MDPVDLAIRSLPATTLVLAVSGGLDSMVLLHAAARELGHDRLKVATFDHGTGDAASRAADQVMASASALGMAAVRGGAAALAPNEAAWRDARWRFLRGVARHAGGGDVGAAGAAPAVIVTAHTRDDHLETVLMRAMRDAGARGLAALYARGDVMRPFVDLTRSVLAAYALKREITWVEDPTNSSMAFLRNRLRRDVMPALSRARPELVGELLALSGRAAGWRARMDALAATCCPSDPLPSGGLSVAAADLVGYHPSSLAVLWASIAGRAGVALDQRGTRRLVAFTMSGAAGGLMPLAGGWLVERDPQSFRLVREAPGPAAPGPLALDKATHWGRWSFVPARECALGDPWCAELPAGLPLVVRSWKPADRMAEGAGQVRVKRVLTEAGIAAGSRMGWPVVVADDAVVWVPGVSRMLAATARSGRPGVCIRCEPSDG